MKCFVRLLVLSDEIRSEQLTELIGLECDKVWNAGDKRGESLIIEKENGWMLSSKKDVSINLEYHIKNIISQIKGLEENLKDISNTEGCAIQLSCAIYYKHEPALCFEKEITIWLSSIGASLDIDLYPSEEE